MEVWNDGFWSTENVVLVQPIAGPGSPGYFLKCSIPVKSCFELQKLRLQWNTKKLTLTISPQT